MRRSKTLDGTPARLEHAKALTSLGTTLRLARRPSEAREPLRRALELAEVCGADPLAARVRSELYATGAWPHTTALSGVESLTPERAADRRPGRGGRIEPGHRPDALRDAEDR